MRFERFFGVILGGLLAFPALAFDEGIEFTRLSQAQPTETGDKIEVLELFWYGCPHCFHMEPALENWVKAAPQNVAFRRMPAVLGPHWEPHARAFYAAEVLGVGEKMHEPLFEALHEKKLKLANENELAEFFAEHGVPKEEFVSAYRSFAVDMKLRRAVAMGKRYGVDGVPAFIVNGKFRTSASQAGSNEKLFAVLDYLIAEETKSAGTGGS
jgi:thiol:disulfide interchange protein DsbA